MTVLTEQAIVSKSLESLIEAPEQEFQKTIQAVQTERERRKQQNAQVRPFENMSDGVLVFQKDGTNLKLVGQYQNTLFGSDAIDRAIKEDGQSPTGTYVWCSGGDLLETARKS